jgi:cytochrome c peroxidase
MHLTFNEESVLLFPRATILLSAIAVLSGCHQSETLVSSAPPETTFPVSVNSEGDAVRDGDNSVATPDASTEGRTLSTEEVEGEQFAQGGPGGMGRGPGRGRGPGGGRGPGMVAGNREDMTTIHALFAARDKITRTVKNLPNGAETLTECKDDEIAALIQAHVPAMDGRVRDNVPLPPMTFHPLFVELIKNADKVTLKDVATDHGVKVTYTSKDRYVVLLIQEHAKLVSRFIKNGMEEIHKPYTIPKLAAATSGASPIKELGLDGEWLPLPSKAPAPENNPTTAARVELGKKLFFDPRLSLTGTVSCNSCHNVMEGGDDGRPSSMGVFGRIGPRNAPTVWNSAFQHSQFWDGRSPSLEDQAKGPLLATPEMGMPTHAFVIDRLRTVPGYVAEFESVFDGGGALNIDNAAKAIAAFERTLITPNSLYDRYVSGSDSVMSDSQIRGLKLFASVGCTECHSGPAFNGWAPESTSPTFEQFPRSTASPYVTKYKLADDEGRSAVTKDANDRNRFKVATLRNITLTAPYFHNGAVESLPEAVRVMATTQLDEKLTDENVADIVSFLAALEGDFPEITLPRIPSRSGETILQDQEPANVSH